MIRIVIADDHTIVREGLKRILATEPSIEVVGEAINGSDTLEKVRKGGFDILLLDLSMPGKSGIEAIKQIKEEQPHLRILVLTMHEESIYAVRAIRAGASGYLTKESAAELLVAALQRIASGKIFISPEVAEQLALNLQPGHLELPHTLLTDREFQVFRLLGAGLSVSDIAEKLNLSVKTVSTHKTKILEKLGAKSLADLIKYAIEHNLLNH